MSNMTASQARVDYLSNMSLDKEEVIELQLNLFEDLLKYYRYEISQSSYTRHSHHFELKTTCRFLPDVLTNIQERGFEIEEYRVQPGDPHDYCGLYPVGTSSQFGNFIGYKFSFQLEIFF